MQEDELVLHRLPCPLHPYVVQAAPDSVHADLDAEGLQDTREVVASELGAAVSVEDCRHPIVLYRLVESLQAEVHLHGVAQPPGEDLAAVQVD